MNFGLLFIFIILQLIINNVLAFIIPTNSIDGLIAFYLLSCLIISFIGAFLSTPREYKRDFIKQPAFHKTMIIYFVVFLIFDAITLLIRLI